MGTLGTAPRLDHLEIQAHEQQSLVPYRDLEKLLRPRHGLVFWIGVIAPWVGGALLWVFALKSVLHQYQLQAQNPSGTEAFVTLAGAIKSQNERAAIAFQSLEKLTTAVASGSTRTDELARHLEQTQRELKKLESRLGADQQSRTISTTKVVTEIKSAPRVHRHEVGEDLRPDISGAEVVLDTNGHLSYWLVPRVVSGHVHMTKVLPIAIHSMGILVHAIAENKDYILAHSGNWIHADISSSSADR